MDVRANRGVCTSDPMDANRIAAAVLLVEHDQLRRPPMADCVPAALRVLVSARDHMASERTAAVNALPALPRVVDLDIDARRALTGTQLLTVSLWLERDEGLGATPDRLEAIHPPKNRTPSARPQRDAVMDPMVRQMWEDNFRVYGAQQIWKAARRAGSDIGRDQVARLMRTDGIEGARTIASMRGGLR